MYKYAGIGSRSTPTDVLDKMGKIAIYLASQQWVLRSGGADGADLAFENAANSVGGEIEIFLPWKGFNGSKDSRFCVVTEEALDIASKIHPAWSRCNDAAKLLHGRNVYQILGWGLNDPVDLVICYAKIELGKPTGGTATAINLALSRNIPVVNLAVSTSLDLWNMLKGFSIDDSIKKMRRIIK